MSTVDIWSRREVVTYLRLLARTGQIRECTRMGVNRDPSGIFRASCEVNAARRVLAYNVATDITGRTAPSSYWWLRCPADCPRFERAEPFLPPPADGEEDAVSSEDLAEIASLLTDRDTELPLPAGEWESGAGAGAGTGPDLAPDIEPRIEIGTHGELRPDAEPAEPVPPAGAGPGDLRLPAAPGSPEADRPAPGPLPEVSITEWDSSGLHESRVEREDRPHAVTARWAVIGTALAAFLIGIAAGQAEPVQHLLHELASLLQ